ncbi:MAG: hypothetical protein U0795_08480 [Pirellulales bacterium]
MQNEQTIRKLIRDTRHRAMQETVAAVLVLVGFSAVFAFSPYGSPQWLGALTILISTGFIVGVVWIYALRETLLTKHSSDDAAFWSGMFRSQARLLRLVPVWYAAPLCVGGIVFALPESNADVVLSLVVLGTFAAVFVGITLMNRAEAIRLERLAGQLSPPGATT